jgi:fructose-1,6-bisphosphatase/inositol monophosphatase family enzyme
MNYWRAEEIASFMYDLGRVALKHYDKPNYRLKEDRSVVTVADIEIEKAMSGKFDRPSESVYMIGEETIVRMSEKYISAALENTAWIVDPVDGTAPYSNHIPTWGISVAFMRAGIIEEGALYLPAMGEFLISDGNDVFYQGNFNGSLENAVRIQNPVLLFDDKALISISQEMSKGGRFNMVNPVQTLSSCVFSLAGIAMGRYLAYIAKVKIWDFAAGWAILSKLGFEAIFSDGRPLGLNVSEKEYFLEKDIPGRWSLKGHFIVGPDRETIEKIMDNSVIPD